MDVFCDLGAMLKARVVLKLNRVGWRPMTEALERTPSSWAARLEAMVGIGVAMIIYCGSKELRRRLYYPKSRRCCADR